MENTISQSNVKRANLILFFFIILKYAICALPIEYGYFRDELFQIAMSHHLAFGYASVPPLLPWSLALVRYLIGDSLFAIHLFSATMGAIVLVLAKMMVKKMNGGLFALFLTLTCLVFAPFFAAIDSMASYDCLSGVFWSAALYCLVSLLVTENKKYWLYFGIAAGLGLMTKFDMFFFGGGLVIALLLTKERKYFLSWQLWVGALIAFLILSPYLIWIAKHNFITLEFFQNYSTQTFSETLLRFFKDQIILLGWVTFPAWAFGLYYFLFDAFGKKFRLLGVTFIASFLLGFFLHAKSYILVHYYVVLFAAGAVFIEKFWRLYGNKIKWALILYIILVCVFGILLIPAMRPVLPINYLPAYGKIFARFIDLRTEKWQQEKITLPQVLQDRIGWEEMAAKVSEVYRSLPAKKKQRAFVLAANYGEASAMDFYRSKYDLPITVCGHQAFYTWIPDNIPQNAVFISIGKPEKKLREICASVKPAANIYTPYAIDYENNQTIYLCEGLQFPAEELKQQIKSMHM